MKIGLTPRQPDDIDTLAHSVRKLGRPSVYLGCQRAGRPGRWALVRFATLGLVACSGEARFSDAATTSYDSAGVTVVQTTEPPAIEWELRSARLRIGTGAEGSPEQQLFRVVTPFRLPDGRYVVGNAGTSEIRLYDADGAYLTAWGRDGEGPGEFRSIAWVRPYRGDSVAVWDDRLDRLTIIGVNGTTGRTVRLSTGGSAAANPVFGTNPRPARVLAVDVLDAGAFLGRVGDVSVGPGDTTAVRRDRFAYQRFDPEGQPGVVFDTVPDDEQFVWSDGRSRSVRPLAFGRSTAVRARDGRIYLADNHAFAIQVLDSSWRVTAIWRMAAANRPVTDVDRERWSTAELAALGDGFLRRVAEQSIRAMRFPETMPHHGDLLPVDGGGAWLETYHPPHTNGPSSWTVFDEDGAVVATIQLPEGFRPTWTDGRELIGIERDALDIERVAIYGIGSP